MHLHNQFHTCNFALSNKTNVVVVVVRAKCFNLGCVYMSSFTLMIFCCSIKQMSSMLSEENAIILGINLHMRFHPCNFALSNKTNIVIVIVRGKCFNLRMHLHVQFYPCDLSLFNKTNVIIVVVRGKCFNLKMHLHEQFHPCNFVLSNKIVIVVVRGK